MSGPWIITIALWVMIAAVGVIAGFTMWRRWKRGGAP